MEYLLRFLDYAITLVSIQYHKINDVFFVGLPRGRGDMPSGVAALDDTEVGVDDGVILMASGVSLMIWLLLLITLSPTPTTLAYTSSNMALTQVHSWPLSSLSSSFCCSCCSDSSPKDEQMVIGMHRANYIYTKDITLSFFLFPL